MKFRIIIAFIAMATIIFLSCTWFQSKKKQTANPLVGEWTLDSIDAGKDTGIAVALIVAAVQDSAGVKISVTKDSIFSHSGNAVDTMSYSFDGKNKEVIINDSLSPEPLSFSSLGDSLVALTTKDSAVLFLRKR